MAQNPEVLSGACKSKLLFVCFGVFETGPHLHLKSGLKLVAQAGLELVILLPQLFDCWG